MASSRKPQIANPTLHTVTVSPKTHKDHIMSLRRQALRGWKNCSTHRSSTAISSVSTKGHRVFTSCAPRRSDSTGPDGLTQVEVTSDSERPRWSYTPERMKAPFSLQQPKDPRRSIWKVNEDPAKLDRMYEKFLGRDLTRTLPDELKWLAVTHKSFDNGRRGFNTRLAFFGRMVVALETTRAIMGSATESSQIPDPYGRQPFKNAALENVDKLNSLQPHQFSSPDKLELLAKEIGLPAVVRWKPRMPDNLAGSGVTVVMASTIFAIIGAISLHHGADVASRVVGERLLKRMGA